MKHISYSELVSRPEERWYVAALGPVTNKVLSQVANDLPGNSFLGELRLGSHPLPFQAVYELPAGALGSVLLLLGTGVHLQMSIFRKEEHQFVEYMIDLVDALEGGREFADGVAKLTQEAKPPSRRKKAKKK